MLVHRRLRQLRDVGDNGLDHPSQSSDLLGETKKCLGSHDGRPEALRGGRESEIQGSKSRVIEQPPVTIRCRSRAEVSAGPVLVRVHKFASVSGSQDLRCGLKLPR
ncbi:hypothetical protein BHE74_00038591 [Ensete ventricosum]|nr:hypothetical protein GW17_00051813 [Ensete ventricosum]RWW54805.1 hypothetical protein BHE74_00038591 [Ensete ventricosum]